MTSRCATRLNETQVETITQTRTWRVTRLGPNTRTQELGQGTGHKGDYKGQEEGQSDMRE